MSSQKTRTEPLYNFLHRIAVAITGVGFQPLEECLLRYPLNLLFASAALRKVALADIYVA
jgi:hypothetical protein